MSHAAGGGDGFSGIVSGADGINMNRSKDCNFNFPGFGSNGSVEKCGCCSMLSVRNGICMNLGCLQNFENECRRQAPAPLPPPHATKNKTKTTNENNRQTTKNNATQAGQMHSQIQSQPQSQGLTDTRVCTRIG